MSRRSPVVQTDLPMLQGVTMVIAVVIVVANLLADVALILVDASSENVIVVAPGANRRLRAEDVDVGDADAVMSQLEIPFEAVRAARAQARFFCLNAAPARDLGELELEPDLLVVNRYEYESAGRQMGLVALTLGAEGAVLLERGEEVARARPPAVSGRRPRPRAR